MSTKPKRPSLIDNFMVRPAAAAGAAAASSVAAEAPSPPPAEPSPPAKPAAVMMPETFRTSVYFARPVHDKLREIAFAERKSITDLINEGLDHVLASRNYATTDELRTKKKRRS